MKVISDQDLIQTLPSEPRRELSELLAELEDRRTSILRAEFGSDVEGEYESKTAGIT
jgi:hypothetical protein